MEDQVSLVYSKSLKLSYKCFDHVLWWIILCHNGSNGGEGGVMEAITTPISSILHIVIRAVPLSTISYRTLLRSPDSGDQCLLGDSVTEVKLRRARLVQGRLSAVNLSPFVGVDLNL
jgi:hypothetical protein